MATAGMLARGGRKFLAGDPWVRKGGEAQGVDVVAYGVRSSARVSGLWWTKAKVATGNSEVWEDGHGIRGGRARDRGMTKRGPGRTSTGAGVNSPPHMRLKPLAPKPRWEPTQVDF